MPVRARPLSPHLEIYRWQISNTLSILHRVTGAILSVGIVALAYWLIALAGGANSYATSARLFSNPVGLLFLFGWSFAFWFHCLNGIRHLFWDAGVGFENPQRRNSGWFAVCGAVLLTVGLWLWTWWHLA